MSSRVNVDMCLIASKGLLPNDRLHKVFLDTLEELHGLISNNTLIINNKAIGRITLNDRIIVQTYSENLSNTQNSTELLRKTFSRRAEVEINNYRDELELEKKRIMESNLALEELNRQIKENEKLISNQEEAIKKQEMPSCEAIVLELKEAAENQGYDIMEEKTEEGVQLQFVRRVY